MKNFFLTFVLMLAAGAAAYGAFYVSSVNPALHEAARDGDAMAWLRTEFKLDDRQFAAIKQLHENYAVVCAEHCASIMSAKHRNAPAPEMQALEETCVRSMTEHFQRVAALMSPDQSSRYLATVLPRVTGYNHAEAPTVQVRR